MAEEQKFEELLKRRKKVMIDFPQWSVFKHKKGDVLELRGIHFVGKGTSRSINENEADNYPEVLREMGWWEEREEKGMPEYVKHKNGVYKQKYLFEKEMYFTQIVNGNAIGWIEVNKDNMSGYLPATKEEYEAQ